MPGNFQLPADLIWRAHYNTALRANHGPTTVHGASFYEISLAIICRRINRALAQAAGAAEPIPGIGPTGEVKKVHGNFNSPKAGGR